MDRLTVGQMAELNGISTQTLRLYDRMGLFQPVYQNNENGYRYYDIRQSAALDMIQYMKALGIPLKEIKEQLEEQDIGVVNRRLQQRIEEIDAQMEALWVTKNAVHNMMRGLEDYKNIPTQGRIIMEELPARRAHCYAVNEDFAARGNEYFETLLRRMKNDMLTKKLPISYFCNVGSTIAGQNLLGRRFISNRIFIWADDYSSGILPVETFPGGRHLCVYFESFRNEARYREAVLREIELSKYTIKGDYICETLAEFPVFRRAERNTVVKIQVPVEG